MAPVAGPWQPAVDVEETDDAFVYEIDVPGVDRDDITVEVRDNDLVISGEYQEKERSGVMHRHTRRTGSFSYRSTLPSGVDQGLDEGGTGQRGAVGDRAQGREVAAAAHRGRGTPRSPVDFPVNGGARPEIPRTEPGRARVRTRPGPGASRLAQQ